MTSAQLPIDLSVARHSGWVNGRVGSLFGCDGSGSGFFRSQSSAFTDVPVGSPGDVYKFVWAVTLPSLADLDTTSMDDSVKAIYVDGSGNKAGAVTSEAITLSPALTTTPEPSSLMLLGTGIIGGAGLLRRRMRQMNAVS